MAMLPLDLKTLPLKKRFIRESSPLSDDQDSRSFTDHSSDGHNHFVDLSRTSDQFMSSSNYDYSLDSLQSAHSNASDGSKFYPESSDQVYKCMDCLKPFCNENSLKVHVRRHLNKKLGRYKCDLCGQTFSQRSGQVSHVRVHTREKPYSCEICYRKFSDFSTFTKHRRVHTGEKPYTCSICKKHFTQSGNMHRHIRVVHNLDHVN